MALTKLVNGKPVELTPEEEAEILAEWDNNAAARAEYISTQLYREQRAKEYPSIGDQLDMIYKAMKDGELPVVTDFVSVIDAVKAKYPKP